MAYRLAWRGGERLDRAIARSRRLTSAQERLGAALARGGGTLVVLARFAPAGRSVVSLGAGAAHRRVREFLPWSILAGLAWAVYSVALGYFGGQWLGATWLATGVSLVALFGAGAGAAYLMRRPVPGEELGQRRRLKLPAPRAGLPLRVPPGRPRSSAVAAAIASTAWSKTSRLWAAGARKPDTLRTYWRAAARISSSVASSGRTGGRSVLMLRHIRPVSRVRRGAVSVDPGVSAPPYRLR